MRQFGWMGIMVLGAFVCADGIAQAQWTNAALFNAAGDNECKTGGIAPATGGGFHFLYLPGNGRLRYRRYYPGGALSGVSTLFYGTVYNTRITESLSGEIHIVFEDWSQGPNNVRWYKSSNGGASFSTTQMLTNINCAKHPQIAAFGTGQSAEMVMSYYRSGTNCDESLWFRRYNGATWTADAPQGSNSASEYDVFGMARSPLDGSIYRTFDASQSTMEIQRYNGSWSSPTQIYSGAWAVRQHMAINPSGQIMLLWDSNSHINAMLYTPGVGSGPVIDLGAGGYSGACDVCAIPGTNDFYMVVARDLGGDNNFHVYGRRWSGGSWLTEESVQNGQNNAFMVTPLVTADAAGNLYCVWEYWGTGQPQQWYSVRPAPVNPGPKGYIAGTVRDSANQPLTGALVFVQNVGTTLTGSTGTYSMQVPVGSYTVQASKLNYSAPDATGVLVTENATTTVNFTMTTVPPAPVTAFNVQVGNRENHLTWTAPASTHFSGVVIRYSTTGYPTGVDDGQLLIDLAGTPESAMSFTHSGLTNGVTCYYAVFTYFQDASRFYNPSGTTGWGTPAGPGDYDRDGDVDQADFAEFQLCLSGDFVPQPNPACQRMKFDPDDDVDQNDLASWQNCYSGPETPSNPYCAN